MSRLLASIALMFPAAVLAEGPPPPPYSLPWQLRPTVAASALRLDTSPAFFDPPGAVEAGPTVAAMLLGSYRVTERIAPLLRVGYVTSSVQDESGSAVLNPLLGVTFVQPLAPSVRLALFFGMALPLGTGGDGASALERAALGNGILARSAMDNAMFATDYLTVFPGVDLSWQASGFTVQAEATVLQLTRMRGDDVAERLGLDDGRTNFTGGLHVGYFAIPELSVGAELRYQRWLSTPSFVEKDPSGALRDNMTFAIGPRVHVKAGDVTLRPGVSYATPVDDPMAAAGYGIVQLDVPVIFP